MLLSNDDLNELDTQVVASTYQGNETVDTWHTQVAEEVPSVTSEVTYAHLVNTAKPRRWRKGQPKVFQGIERGSRKVVNDRYEMTVNADRDQLADDLTGLFRRELVDLAFENGQKYKQVKDELAAEILIDNELCMDGAALFGTHYCNPLASSGTTYDNAFTGYPLSPENAARARARIFEVKGADGMPRKLRLTHVLVAPAQEARALHIFGASQINGTDNPMKGKAQVIVAPELMTTTANPLGDETWYGLALAGRKRPLQHQMREALKALALFDPRDPNVWERNELVWTSSERFALAAGYPYTIYRFRP